MSTQRTFLEQFDPDVIPHILEFGKRLSSLRADVFIVMARKAACFVQALRDLNYARPDALITTDRVLDMDMAWLRGKQVALVDEALISGTTLYKTRKQLEEAGATAVEIHAFCVNMEWWARNLAVPQRPYLELSDKQTTAFCADVVNAITLLPLPYSVDYPHLANLRIQDRDAYRLWSVTAWSSHDLTSSSQREHGVATFTLLPSEPIQRQVDADLGWPLSRHSQLVKIRVYARRPKRSGGLWSFQVVPMVVLDPIRTTTIDSIWTRILSSCPLAKKVALSEAFTSPTARLRLIQYLAAMKFGRMYFECARLPESEPSAHAMPSRQSLQNVFTPSTIEAVEHLIGRRTKLFDGAATEGGKPRPTTDLNFPPSPSSSTVELCDVQRALTQPFLDLYTNEEIPARRLALKHGRLVFSDPKLTGKMDRLSMGFSVDYLRHTIAGTVPAELEQIIVSLFLDLAIDGGIIVPVTKIEGEQLVRAYRHGEDVLFGASEERLVYIVINSFLKNSGRSAAPRLWVEKLIVLLLRIGVQQGFLKRSYGTLGEDGTVGVRYALKGAVAMIEQARLYGMDFDNTVTNSLVRYGLFTVDSKHLYRLGNPPDERAPTKAGAESKASLIGSIFGMLHTGQRGAPHLNNQDLILLATCLTPNDVAAAVAAEMNIFRRAWRRDDHAAGAIKPDKAEARLKYLSSSQIVEALASGAWKYKAHVTGKPWALVDEIANGLEDVIHRETWRTFWPSSGSQDDGALSELLEGILARQGRWITDANLALRLLQVSLGIIAGTVTDAKLDQLLATIELLAADLDESKQHRYRNLRQQVRDGSFRAHDVRVYAEKQLDSLRYKADGLLDRVDTTVTAYGRPVATERFQHAMFVTIVADHTTGGRAWTSAEKIVVNHRARIRGGSAVARIEMIPIGVAGYEHGFWLCATGREGRVRLITLAAALYDKLANAHLRMALFSSLPLDEQLHLREFTSTFVGKNFWPRVAAILEKHNYLRDSGPPMTCFTISSEASHEALKDELLVLGFTLLSAGERIYDRPSAERYRVQTFVRKLVKPQIRGDKVRHGADIGIINIVTEEVQATLAELRRHGSYETREGKRSLNVFYEGELPAQEGRHSVAVTQQLDQGNRSVMKAYEVLKQEYAPALIVLLGIGGGIHRDVGLGDVAIADKIYYYDSRKVTSEGVQHREEPDRLPAWLRSQLNHFFVQNSHPAEFDAGVDCPKPRYRVQFGPIGSGEAVLAYRKADERQWLLSVNDKTLAVETEGKGLATAFYEEALEYDRATRGYLVIRGISDHADEEKNDAFRHFAAANAASTLAAVVKQFPRLSTWEGLHRI